MAAAIASGCLTGSTPADRSEVIRQILPTTVQLRCERDANDRRAASGVVVGRDSGTRRAWVVTTRHFLEPLKAQKVYVKAAGDQARVAATLVKVSDQADLALLEVQGFDAPPARLKETVQIGDEVWVVAYPWGRRMTLSNGVVSQVTHADGDAGGAASPRAAEAVGDDNTEHDAVTGGKLAAQLLRRAVGIERQQQRALHAVGRPDIGLVDAGIGHDVAQPVLDDQDIRPRAHHAHRFRQDQLDQPRILLNFLGKLDGAR